MTAVRAPAWYLALLLLAGGCSRRAAQPPAPNGAIERTGLESVVGRRARGDSLPIRGARVQRAWLVTSLSDSGATWGLEHLTRNGRDILVLQREVGRDGSLPVWVVSDAGYLPPLPRSFRLATTCGYGEQADPRVIAVVRNTPTRQQVDVRWAWIANTATGRIDTTATSGLHCENEGP